MPGLRPNVNAIDTVLLLNNSVAASDLFTVSDPDGDTITEFIFNDAPGASSGFFIFQGSVIGQGGSITISANDLDDLRYVAGPTVNTEFISIQASDGTLLSDAELVKIYTARPESVRPLVQIDPITILGNESVLASSFISAFDPDGFPIQSFSVRDRIDDRSFFSLDGQEIQQGIFHSFNAEDFGRLVYNAVGRRSENIDVFAFDGSVQSEFTTEVINVRANLNRPVVEFNTGITQQDELLPIADLLNVFDSDGNTVKYFELKDRNRKSFSGNLVFQGQDLAPGQFHRFNPDEIDQVFFRGGERSIVEQVRYRVNDGRFRSSIRTVALTNVAGSGELGRPVVESINGGLYFDSHLETQLLSDLIEPDEGALPIIQYEILDSNPNEVTAKLMLGENELTGGQIQTLTPEEFSQLEIVTGEYIDRFLDEVYIRADNGTFVSEWERINVRSEPEFFGALFSGATWNFIPRNEFGKIELTYSFMQQFPDYDTGEAEDNPLAMPFPRPFTPLNDNQRDAVRIALAQLESYADVDFIEVSDTSVDPVSGNRGGTYRFGNYSVEGPPPVGPSVAAAFAFFPGGAPQSGDIWFNDWFLDIENFDPGTGEFTTLLHELGHSLGYNHAFDLALPGGPDQNPVLPERTNNDLFTVMGGGGRPDFVSPQSFQLYDVFQIQTLYGANTDFNSGDDTYGVDNFILGANSAISLWDGGGDDTLTAAGTNGASIDLRQGAFSSIGNLTNNISIAFGAEIENATGSDGNDVLFGNELNNRLIGEAGSDTLRGYGGNDFLSGGAGGDTYVFTVADGSNRIDEMQLAGRDRIQIEDPMGQFGINNLQTDFLFRLEGRDLVISLTLNEEGQSDTTIRITDQTRGSFRIESLEFGTNTIDLVNLTDQSTGANQRFQISAETSVFGNLVTPV